MGLPAKVVVALVVVVVAVGLGYPLRAPLPDGVADVVHVEISPVGERFLSFLKREKVEPERNLVATELLGSGHPLVHGLETIEPHPSDPALLYACNVKGQLLKLRISTKDDRTMIDSIEVVAELGGRGLGIKLAPNGDLYIANEVLGLQAVDPQGQVRVVANRVSNSDQPEIRFADDLDIDAEGVVYFSDATQLPHEGHSAAIRSILSMFSGVRDGRLLRYDPKTGETVELLSGLLFANGVALSKNQDFVLICETGRYRVHRYWIKGPKAGTSDVFADDLPGFPDGVSHGKTSNSFWVASYVARPALANLLARLPLLRRMALTLLPAEVLASAAPPPKHGMGFEFDEEGNLLSVLEDRTGSKVPSITAITEVSEGSQISLYFGSLNGTTIPKWTRSR